MFRWNDERWTLVRDKLKLPKTVMPPRIVGSTLLVRDEGHGENDKRLWWTDVTSDQPLIAHDQALGFGWFDALSYQFTRAGEFWFSTGNSSFPGWTLVRRLKHGEFRLAVVGGQTRFLANDETKPVVNITAIKELSNGQLVGAGDLGFYRIEDDQIITLVRFRESSQITADNLDWRWDPTDLVELSPRRFIISGLFGGIYLLDLSADEYGLLQSAKALVPVMLTGDDIRSADAEKLTALVEAKFAAQYRELYAVRHDAIAYDRASQPPSYSRD